MIRQLTRRSSWLLALVMLTAPAAGLEGTLGPNQIFTSQALGYDLQYRVYSPPGEHSELPVLYVTDGQWYIEPGELHVVLDQMIAEGSIEPVLAVFVDNRDPHAEIFARRLVIRRRAFRVGGVARRPQFAKGVFKPQSSAATV